MKKQTKSNFQTIISAAFAVVVMLVVLGCNAWSELKSTSPENNSSNGSSNAGSKTKTPDTKTDSSSPSLKNSIVGSWSATKDGQTLTQTFTKDGKITISIGGREKSARYQVIDEQTISLTGSNERKKVTISGDTLTMDIDGKPTDFKRVNDQVESDDDEN